MEIHLTSDELARRWRVGIGTLRNDRCSGRGCRYVKLGGSVRYRLADVLAYEEACASNSTSEYGANPTRREVGQ